MPILRFVIVALLVPASGSAQDAAPVTLRWKVAEGPMAYKASLKAGKPMEFDVAAMAREAGELVKKLSPAGAPPPQEFPEKLKEFLGTLKLPDEFAMTLILAPAAGDRISVKLIQNKSPLPAGDSPIEKLLKEMEGTVQLRGEIDPSGVITSWWLQTNQKNLVAILCELPRKPVRSRDQWSLDLNLVQMGPGFIVEKAERTNLVRLAGVRQDPGGEVVAQLEYLLSESAEGEFFMASGQKGQPTSMALSFVGKAEFSITKGAWRSFVGQMKTKATGFMKSDASQEIGLERLATVPEELLKLR